MIRITEPAATHLVPIFRKLERVEAYVRRKQRRQVPRYKRERQEQRV